MEMRVVAAIAKYKCSGPVNLAIARAVIREMRTPTADMIQAMGRALNRHKRGMGGHVTWSLKHQMRWAAAIDAASPPEGV